MSPLHRHPKPLYKPEVFAVANSCEKPQLIERAPELKLGRASVPSRSLPGSLPHPKKRLAGGKGRTIGASSPNTGKKTKFCRFAAGQYPDCQKIARFGSLDEIKLGSSLHPAKEPESPIFSKGEADASEHEQSVSPAWLPLPGSLGLMGWVVPVGFYWAQPPTP